MKKLLIYLPAYNEDEKISKVIQSIPREIEGVEEVEILVVNDGSEDRTREEAEKNGVLVMNHKMNMGVGEAFKTAINFALKEKFDLLVSFDSDGQFNPREIKNFITPIINEEADFCIGNRFNNGRPPFMSKLKFRGNLIVNKIISSISKVEISDASCGFRSYSRECLLHLNLQGSYTYTHETILNLMHKGFFVKQIPVQVEYFEERVSRVAGSIWKYGVKTSKIILKCLIDYSSFYFFLSIAGFFTLISFLIGGFVGVHWLNSGSISPYKSFGIIAIALLGMALIVCVLAFVGDILGRVRRNQEEILYHLKKIDV